MKKLLLLTFLISYACFSQVGIGTTTPEADLHVAGDVAVQQGFSIGTLSSVSATEEDFKLVTRVNNSFVLNGEITQLNVNTLTVAPINTVDYHISGISSDNVTDLDLQYDATKYVVAVSNFRYVGDAIKKVYAQSGSPNIGHFVVHAFTSGGTWHLEIRNRNLDLDPGDSLEYYVTLVVYDKSFYRHLPTITTDLNGSNTGTAASVPNLY